jgi:hypothetical protein
LVLPSVVLSEKSPMAATFKVRCPNCSSGLRVPVDRGGTQIICPGCKRPIAIPATLDVPVVRAVTPKDLFSAVKSTTPDGSEDATFAPAEAPRADKSYPTWPPTRWLLLMGGSIALSLAFCLIGFSFWLQASRLANRDRATAPIVNGGEPAASAEVIGTPGEIKDGKIVLPPWKLPPLPKLTQTYQGKYADFWYPRYHDSNVDFAVDAERALKGIGVEAIPYLLRGLKDERTRHQDLFVLSVMGDGGPYREYVWPALVHILLTDPADRVTPAGMLGYHVEAIPYLQHARETEKDAAVQKSISAALEKLRSKGKK